MEEVPCLHKGVDTEGYTMLSFTKESTHYLIMANIWLAAMVLATHTHDAVLCGVIGTFMFVIGYVISRKERED